MDADPRLDDSRLLAAAPSSSDDWDDDTWAAWARIADRAHAARPTIAELLAELAEARTKLEIAERRNEELAERLDKDNRLSEELIRERDWMGDMADRLAYAIAPIEDIGEHSSENCPWQNALDRVTSAAEVARLRKENAELERALGLNEAA